MSIDDIGIPKTVTARIGKNALPQGMQIQKDAKSALSRSCTVFISYLASAAHEYTRKRNHKILTPEDVFQALNTIEFQELAPKLRKLTKTYNTQQKMKRANRKKERESGAGLGEEDDHAMDDADGKLMEDQEPEVEVALSAQPESYEDSTDPGHTSKRQKLE